MTDPTHPTDSDASVVRPLFVHTHIEPSLGADAWVHTQIMRHLERPTHDISLAYVPHVSERATPLHHAVADITDLERIAIAPGPSRSAARTLRGAASMGVDMLRWIVDLARVAVHVRRRGVHVLHTADRPRDAMAAVLIGRVTRRPSIVHVHVAYGEWMTRGRKWAIMSADHRIAVSEFVRSGLVEAGADPSTTYTVLNAIEPERWKPTEDQRAAARAALDLAPDAPVLITVCRLFESKGTAALIRAVAAVAGRVPQVQLLVVGRDPSHDQAYLRSLEALVAELGIGDRVRFLGERSDVPDLMAAADVFAMPSTEEPFGLVFAEAMASGLPIVAVDDGGTPEVVRHGVDGLLSPSDDVETLAEHLSRLLVDPAWRRELASSGMERTRSDFTVRRQADDVADVYRRITMRRQPHRRSRRKARWNV